MALTSLTPVNRAPRRQATRTNIANVGAQYVMSLVTYRVLLK